MEGCENFYEIKKEGYLCFSFFISLLIHLSVLAQFPVLSPKVSYQKPSKTWQIDDLKKLSINKERYIFSLPDNPPPYLRIEGAEKFILENKVEFINQPRFLEEARKEIVISEMVEANFRKLPKYMEYYQKIRAQIDRTAHRLYQGEESGEVVLSFVLLKDGKVLNVFLENDEGVSIFLKKIAQKAIYDAQPFPAFPEELKKYSYLPFKISIYFKNSFRNF